MRVLWITDIFPHFGRPHLGAWMADLAAAVAHRAGVRVLTPRYRSPWVPRGSYLEWYRRPGPRIANRIEVDCPAPPAAFYMLAQAASMARSMLAVARREHRRSRFDVVHGQSIVPGGMAAAWIASRLGVPLVLTAQGADINEFPNVRHLRPWILGSLRRAARITAVSRDLVRRLADLGRAAAWIPNGCTVRAGDPVHRRRGSILFVGNLYERKGPDVLLKAFARVRESIPDATLDIVGDGRDRAQLQAAASAGVRFHGALPHDRSRAMMGEADVLCLPSRREGWPLVAVEALEGGLPVIGSDIGGIRELIADPALGTLVPADDDSALAAALVRALRHPWNRARIRAEARRYDWKGIADRYLDAYREAIASRTMRSSASAIRGAE